VPTCFGRRLESVDVIGSRSKAIYFTPFDDSQTVQNWGVDGGIHSVVTIESYKFNGMVFCLLWFWIVIPFQDTPCNFGVGILLPLFHRADLGAKLSPDWPVMHWVLPRALLPMQKHRRGAKRGTR
jgi:hypothetical protein